MQRKYIKIIRIFFSVTNLELRDLFCLGHSFRINQLTFIIQKCEMKLSRMNWTEIGVSKGRVRLYGMLNKNKNTKVL